MKKILLYMWQLPQNIVGFLLHLGCEKMFLFGYTYYINKLFKDGISLGNYILLYPKEIFFCDLENVLKHLYGHQIQSKYLGPLYLFVVGIPSVIGYFIYKNREKDKEWYYNLPWERWAEKLSRRKK